MLCIRPFRTAYGEHGCGQCMPCRVNKRRMWTGRIVAEAGCHDANAFVTLTYQEKFCKGTVDPKDLRLYLRRLRWKRGPLRFYGVGEYGDKNFRPHYHVALFGVSMYEEEAIVGSWTDSESGEQIGGVHIGELNNDSAQYIAGYICKKMTAKDDPRLKEGMHPEFVRMSLRPGLGRGAAKLVARSLSTPGALDAVARIGDVPSTLRISGKLYPMGRYFRRALREELGWNPETPQVSLQANALAYQSLTSEELATRERKREVGYFQLVNRVKIDRSKRRM